MALSEQISTNSQPGRSIDAFSLRPAVPEDRNFIYATWLKGYHAQRRPRNADKEFYAYWEPVVTQVLERPNTELWVLCAASEPNHIAGWVCYEGMGEFAVIHWAHLKGKPVGYRGLGLLWKMLGAGGIGPASRIVYTFPCKRAKSIAARFAEHDEYPVEEFLK